MWEVYLEGSNNPVWTYKTTTWLRKRYDELASLRSIPSAKVIYTDSFGNRIQYKVMFNHKGINSWMVTRVFA